MIWLVISSRDPTSWSVFNTGSVCKYNTAVPPTLRCRDHRRKQQLLVTGGCSFNATKIRRQSGTFVCSDQSHTAVSSILQFKTGFCLVAFPVEFRLYHLKEISAPVFASVCLAAEIPASADFSFTVLSSLAAEENLSWYFSYPSACLITQ